MEELWDRVCNGKRHLELYKSVDVSGKALMIVECHRPRLTATGPTWEAALKDLLKKLKGKEGFSNER